MQETQGWVLAIVGGLSSLVTLFATKGVDAWLRVRKSGLEERKYEDGRAVEGYQTTISELKARVTHLETLLEMQEKKYTSEIEALRREHIDCVKLQTALSVQNEHQAKEMRRLDDEIQSLREWRHSIANAAQVKVIEGAPVT